MQLPGLQASPFLCHCLGGSRTSPSMKYLLNPHHTLWWAFCCCLCFVSEEACLRWSLEFSRIHTGQKARWVSSPGLPAPMSWLSSMSHQCPFVIDPFRHYIYVRNKANHLWSLTIIRKFSSKKIISLSVLLGIKLLIAKILKLSAWTQVVN